MNFRADHFLLILHHSASFDTFSVFFSLFLELFGYFSFRKYYVPVNMDVCEYSVLTGDSQRQAQ